jgi:hypothetical protein
LYIALDKVKILSLITKTPIILPLLSYISLTYFILLNLSDEIEQVEAMESVHIPQLSLCDVVSERTLLLADSTGIPTAEVVTQFVAAKLLELRLRARPHLHPVLAVLFFFH